jgi:hypothetical protein
MPDIAIIAWGSLLWEPRLLGLRSKWRADGPRLPIEFSRVSRDGRLTLVIDPSAPDVTTYWALSDRGNVADARENLRQREGNPPAQMVHWVTVEGVPGSIDPDPISAVILEWLSRKGLYTAVWTGLPANHIEKLGKPDGRIAYLKSLVGEDMERAENYIRKAPPQTRTPLRDEIESTLRWQPIALDATVLEDGS